MCYGIQRIKGPVTSVARIKNQQLIAPNNSTWAMTPIMVNNQELYSHHGQSPLLGHFPG